MSEEAPERRHLPLTLPTAYPWCQAMGLDAGWRLVFCEGHAVVQWRRSTLSITLASREEQRAESREEQRAERSSEQRAERNREQKAERSRAQRARRSKEQR